MEREIWIRGGMVLSVFSLVGLILWTPSLLGRPAPELASLPLLVIGMSRNQSTFIVNLGSAFSPYRYALIRISMSGTQPWGTGNASWNSTWSWNDTYGDHAWIPANATFSIRAYLVDQQRNYFEYNVSVRTEKDVNGKTVMVFTFPLEPDNQNTIYYRTVSEDLRLAIPRRGTLP